MASWEQLKAYLKNPDVAVKELAAKKRGLDADMDQDLIQKSKEDADRTDSMMPEGSPKTDPMAMYNTMTAAEGLGNVSGITKAGKLFGPSGKLLNEASYGSSLQNTGEGLAAHAKNIIKSQKDNLVPSQKTAFEKALWAEQARNPKLNEDDMFDIAKKLGVQTGDEVPMGIDIAKKNIANYPKTPDLGATQSLDVFKNGDLAKELKQSDPENFKKVVDLMKKRSPEAINAAEVERQANAIGPKPAIENRLKTPEEIKELLTNLDKVLAENKNIVPRNSSELLAERIESVRKAHPEDATHIIDIPESESMDQVKLRLLKQFRGDK